MEGRSYTIKNGGAAKKAAKDRQREAALTTFEVGELQTQVDAIQALEGLAAAEKFLKALRYALKEFVKAHGPVEHEDREWGPVVSVRKKKLSVTRDEVRLLLLDCGAPKALIARVDKKLETMGIDGETPSETFRWTKR